MKVKCAKIKYIHCYILLHLQKLKFMQLTNTDRYSIIFSIATATLWEYY